MVFQTLFKSDSLGRALPLVDMSRADRLMLCAHLLVTASLNRARGTISDVRYHRWRLKAFSALSATTRFTSL